jgi:hypothetical protein
MILIRIKNKKDRTDECLRKCLIIQKRILNGQVALISGIKMNEEIKIAYIC